MKTIEGLKYTKDHEWIRAEGSRAFIGITDYAQHALGDIVFVELPGVGSTLEKDTAFGVVESVKAVSDVFTPVSGRVVEINEEISDNPALINEDAFKSWMICVEMSDGNELGGLLSADEYAKYCSALE